ncbi:MAG: gliding motility-associated C-terminal domain-containing protein [Lewinellaceae bacterium]|nr:gliding motility-associated C-terminal domain-containing protein [Lewinellaceae bacterium]
MRLYLLLISFLCLSSIVFSQSYSGFCAQEELQQAFFRENPDLLKRFNKLESQYEEAVQQGDRQPLPPYTLPVVVHIIHDNGAENISDAMVLQGLDHLNQAYANIGYYDQNTGVNTQIQFCLAKRDPDGNATTGINRVVSPLTELNYTLQDLDLKNLIRWDPYHYINIWLVREICNNNGCSVAGYAYLPGAHGGAHDGIVMEAKWFGSSNGNSGVQIHEMGHYLGLYHTFEGGCTNNNCLSDGDRVCDTPPDQSTVPVPCGGSANSCSTDTQSGFATDQNDMFWDYMDYGNWNCYSAFTQGQADRMAFFIDNVRYSLLESDGCQDPCLSAITAGFTSSANLVDIGTTVNFTNTSVNATGYQWLVDGVPFGNGLNASYTFNTLGTFIISLETTNADPNCFDSVQDTIEVTCPVMAAFEPTNLFPLPGEIVNFGNNSSGGTNFSWSVNGGVQANTMAFSYVFPAEGAYTICLEVDNGLCSDEYCQLLFAYNSGTGCESGYLKILGSQGVAEVSNQILIESNGNALIGGGAGQESLLLEVDGSGNVIWERVFNIIPGVEFIRTMFIDDQGFLVLGGRDDLVQPDYHYLGKYDLNNQSWVWLRTWNSNYYPRIDGMFQNPANGNYIAYGMVEAVGNDQYILELDQATGAPLWQKQFDFGGTTDHLTEHTIVGNKVYFGGAVRHAGGGLDKIRAAILKTDFNGNMDWERQYFNTPNQTARTYVVDLAWEGDTIVALGRGSFTGSDLTMASAHLFKTDLDGNLLWGRSYLIGGGTDVFSTQLLPLPDGYVLQGDYKKNGIDEIFFIRTDKLGNVIWAKGVGNSGADWSTSALIHDNAIFFTGRTDAVDVGGSTDIFFGRIPLDAANQNDSCSWLHDLYVSASYIQYNYDPTITLTQTTPANVWQSQTAGGESITSDIQDVPGCACIDSIPCATTYVRSLGDLGPEQGRRIIPEPGGGFLLGGSKGDSCMIALLDSDGHPIWQRTIKGTSFPNERISDLLIDSDQQLIGTATATSGVNTTANFIFKYDYQNDALHWLWAPTTVPFNTASLLSIQEAAPGGNYLIAGQTAPNSNPGSGCDGVLMELDRNTGAQVWIRNYHLGSCETFSKIVVHANTIYATGRYNFAGGGLDKMRAGVSQLDLAGNELWSRLYLVDVNTNARLYSADMVIDNGLVIPSFGDMNGTSANDVELQLFKTDYSGNILWAQQFDIPGGSTERFARLVNLPDGYLALGTYNISGNDDALFLLKTDKNGVLQWSKRYGANGSEFGYDLLYQAGWLYLTGSTNNFGPGGMDVLLARLTLDGLTPDSCDVIQDLSMVQTPIIDPYDGLHPLTVYTPNWPFFDPGSIFQPTTLPENVLCETPCVDPCLVAPDAFFQLLAGACNGDSLSVTVEVCNEGEGFLYAGTPVNFYDGDPAGGAALIGSYGLPADLAKDSCLTWTFNLAAGPNTTIFAWVNDETAPAFDDMECDVGDNLASFSVNYTPPLLDLGPDTIMCGFGVVSLEANPGFAGYQWQDGSTGATYTALEPGAHWVTAIDSCGGVQSDTVWITVYSSAQSFDTLFFCSGDTVLIFGDPVTQVGDYTALLTGFHGCDSLATITLVEQTDTLFTNTAATICSDSTVVFFGQTLDSSGVYTYVDSSSTCLKIDMLTLEVLPVQAVSETLSTCANEPVDVFGVPISVSGTYVQTFASQNGCDSVHTIVLNVLDTVAVTENISTCVDQPVVIFGQSTTVAGTYSQTTMGYNGCDSVHTVVLAVFDTLNIQETLSICQGESAQIFGAPVSVAGTYSQLFTSIHGCDSTHTIVLIVADTSSVIEEITTCANEPVDVFGVSTNVSGTYTQTFQNASGCDSTHTIQLSVLDTLATSEALTTCANAPVDVYGVPTSVSGTYVQTFSAQNGCDSVHTIVLTVLDTLTTSESLTSCDGEGVFIFGTLVSTSGTYAQTFTSANGCDSTHSVMLTVFPPIDVSIEAGDVTCYGDTDGSATVTFSDPGLVFSLDGQNYSAQVNWGNLSPGGYTLYAQDAGGCILETDFTIGQPAPVNVLLPPGLTLELGQSEQLSATVTPPGGVYVYAWSPPGGLSCTDCPDPLAQPGATTTYLLIVTDTLGCTAQASIVITVERNQRVYIPNIFSPNADGLNDVFTVFGGPEVQRIRTLMIFDRWGEKVFEGVDLRPNDLGQGWDGTFRGKSMNPGVFGYLAELEFADGIVLVFNGSLTLVR